MTVSSFHLPAKIYQYLSINEGRPVPFNELCVFVYESVWQEENVSKNSIVSKACQTQIMEALLFLSDINLVILDENTDTSTLRSICRN